MIAKSTSFGRPGALLAAGQLFYPERLALPATVFVRCFKGPEFDTALLNLSVQTFYSKPFPKREHHMLTQTIP
jgi:hypothetical protein